MSNTEPGQWDFGLTAAQETHAADLHQKSIVVDMLNQHPGGANIYAAYPPELIDPLVDQLESGMVGMAQAIQLPYELDYEGHSNLIQQWWQQSGITAGVLHIPMGPPDKMAGPLTGYANLAEYLKKIDWLPLVTTAAEIRTAKQQGTHALYGYWQPVYGLSNDLKDINQAYDQGLRMLMLTYNRMDYVGAGCTERVDAGLSMYGVEVVKRCNELGIIVDTSHSGKQTTLDACDYSSTPVFANHTLAQGVFNHARGKSDKELKRIAATGGVVGVVTVPAFLGDNPNIETVLDHIDYIANLIGYQHVGLGTDWPMQGPVSVIQNTLGAVASDIGFRKQDQLDPSQSLPGFDDCRDMPNITRGLVKRGYSDEQIQGILGENFLRVFEAVCG